MTEPLLRTEQLTRHFSVGNALSRKRLHAVDDAELTVREREIVAVAGESGSGKSTLARLLAMVYRPTAGEVYFRGRPLSGLRSRKDVLAYRGEVPMVFQDPFSSLNPAYRVSHGILRTLTLHRPDLTGAARRAEAERVLESVGLTPAGEVLDKYPHEFSGGQRQRIGFAQALACQPKLILADEPVSMLDVSIRVGLLNLMAPASRCSTSPTTWPAPATSPTGWSSCMPDTSWRPARPTRCCAGPDTPTPNCSAPPCRTRRCRWTPPCAGISANRPR
jgi:peptide/nickel transport system ATP-binding protein